jgi:MFS family permease
MNSTPVVIGLLIGILVAAMDNTIVATAMPTIVSELNGFDQYAGVTSAYKIATVD